MYEYDDIDEDQDEYFSELANCHTTDCIMIGAHFSSECHTAEDLESYDIACQDFAN